MRYLYCINKRINGLVVCWRWKRITLRFPFNGYFERRMRISGRVWCQSIESLHCINGIRNWLQNRFRFWTKNQNLGKHWIVDNDKFNHMLRVWLRGEFQSWFWMFDFNLSYEFIKLNDWRWSIDESTKLSLVPLLQGMAHIEPVFH